MTTRFKHHMVNLQTTLLANRRLSLLFTALLVLFVLAGTSSAHLEQRTLSWLQSRQAIESDAFVLASAPSQLDNLSESQAMLVSWLSRKYRVAPEPLSAIVVEAFELGTEKGLDPALILAVMANESRFNPLAQSPVGAQGLMQVLTRVHTDKFEALGGTEAAFDPFVNMRVGTKILKESIKRAGSVEGGLKFYVGAVNTDASAYINKVIAEQMRLHQVMSGKSTSFTALPPDMPIFEDTKARLMTASSENN